jgi:hypothetical protein
MQVVRVVLQALRDRCQEQHEQQQEQEQQAQHTGDCHHKQQQQEQPARLLLVEVAEVVRGAWGYACGDRHYACKCAQVLGVVLDVLGVELTGQMCWEIQEKGLTLFHVQFPQQSIPYRLFQQSCLAEALLLGWLGAVEQLHAARQLVLARLQRLVLGVPASGQQEQEREEAESSTRQQGQRRKRQQGVVVHLEQLVKGAALAAAAGRSRRHCGYWSSLLPCTWLPTSSCSSGSEWTRKRSKVTPLEAAACSPIRVVCLSRPTTSSSS